MFLFSILLFLLIFFITRFSIIFILSIIMKKDFNKKTKKRNN